MKTITYETLKKAYDKKNYIFNEGIYHLNIFGVRCNAYGSNKFDDIIGCAYVSEIGTRVLFMASGTTDAGQVYIKHPMNAKGCAAVVPGQYHNSHKIGMHRGYHKALVQCGNVAVYRDNNKDDKYDYNPDSIDKGCGFGINIHRASAHSVADAVNNYSAGCQVFQKSDDLEYLLSLCDKQIAYNRLTLFTYTLFDEADI